MQSDELRLWLSLPLTDELRIRLQQASFKSRFADQRAAEGGRGDGDFLI
jgi:hypothetical protein